MKKIASFAVVFLLLRGVIFAQRSVMIEELTTSEVSAAIVDGKTTVFLYSGGVHESKYKATAPDPVALGKHNFVANYIARHVAEGLGNALAFVFPASPQGDPVKKTVHMMFAGTVTLSEDTYERAIRDICSSLKTAGFKNIVMAGDHGLGQTAMKKVAADLDPQWSSEGVHVFFFPVYADAKKELKAYVTTQGVPAKLGDRDLHTELEDITEVMFVDREGAWVRKDKIPPEVAKWATAATGKVFVEQKINIALKYIRSQVGTAAASRNR